MTREEALAFYHPIRESVRRILGAAISACNQSDLIRAAKQLRLWGDGKISLPEGEQAAEMLSEIALFEPNQRGAPVTICSKSSKSVMAADRRSSPLNFPCPHGMT